MADPPPDDTLARLALDAAPNGIVIVDRGGRIVYANARIEVDFGWPRAELVGGPVGRLLPGAEDALAGDVATGDRLAERPARRSDGAEVPVEVALEPLATPDGPLVLATVTDLTARRAEAERLARSLREKETLLREVHHRVNNNLQVLSSLLALQARYARDAELKGALTDAHRRVYSIALVHETLYRTGDLARVDLAEYVRTLVGQLASTYGKGRPIATTLELAPGIAVPVDVAVPCGLMVNELVSNAFRHAFPADGPGTVRVSVAREAGGIRITVADDGVGLPPGVDVANPSRMGLRLVKTLAGQLATRIDVAGPPGAAITFRIGSPT